MAAINNITNSLTNNPDAFNRNDYLARFPKFSVLYNLSWISDIFFF